MSRKPTTIPTSQLRRQHSVKTEDVYQLDCRSSPRQVNPHNISFPRAPEQSKYQEKMISKNQNVAFEPSRNRDQNEELNQRYLGVIDSCLSGHSSVVAISRVSQQPSFESYDSSVSATSWPSSNDPEYANTFPTQSGTQMLHSDPYEQQRSAYSKSERQPQSLRGRLFKMSHASVDVHDSTVTSVDPLTSSCREPGTPKEKEKRRASSSTRAKTGSKTLGNGKEELHDAKQSSPISGQRFKGLWKRAYQTLRMDKLRKDKSTSDKRDSITTTSDEVDPVYHLLRCAANKSQTTAAATAGIDRTLAEGSPTKPAPYRFMKHGRSASVRITKRY